MDRMRENWQPRKKNTRAPTDTDTYILAKFEKKKKIHENRADYGRRKCATCIVKKEKKKENEKKLLFKSNMC